MVCLRWRSSLSSENFHMATLAANIVMFLGCCGNANSLSLFDVLEKYEYLILYGFQCDTGKNAPIISRFTLRVLLFGLDANNFPFVMCWQDTNHRWFPVWRERIKKSIFLFAVYGGVLLIPPICCRAYRPQGRRLKSSNLAARGGFAGFVISWNIGYFRERGGGLLVKVMGMGRKIGIPPPQHPHHTSRCLVLPLMMLRGSTTPC